MPYENLVLVLLALIAGLLAVLFRELRAGHRDAVRQAEETRARLAPERRRLFGQIATWLSLRDRLDLRQGLPYSHNWSAAPDFLAEIVDHALAARPATIVECSSGLTTLMLARCCEMNGQGRVWSLENGPEYAARTRAEIARYGLEGRAEVIDAPLVTYTLAGRDYLWYGLAGLPEQAIDMLVIDGPPGFIQRHARYPALPLLSDRLADVCTVFLDDAARPDERAIVAWWREALPGAQVRFVDNERGCAILRLSRPER